MQVNRPKPKQNSTKHAELSMLLIVADDHEEGLELSVRRDRFNCAEFSYAVAPDERSGTVLLLPDKRALRVSSTRDDYERVRIFDKEGILVGTMICAQDGRVTWSAAVYR